MKLTPLSLIQVKRQKQTGKQGEKKRGRYVGSPAEVDVQCWGWGHGNKWQESLLWMKKPNNWETMFQNAMEILCLDDKKHKNSYFNGWELAVCN